MEPAFWDTSSLVPLCVVQPSSTVVRQLSIQYQIVVWWSTPVEIKSAFARLVRTGLLSKPDSLAAQNVLEVLRRNWREVQPGEQLRALAETFVDRFPLKAADAQQLAAAYKWSVGQPHSRVFIGGDIQLLESARQLGFQTVAT